MTKSQKFQAADTSHQDISGLFSGSYSICFVICFFICFIICFVICFVICFTIYFIICFTVCFACLFCYFFCLHHTLIRSATSFPIARRILFIPIIMLSLPCWNTLMVLPSLMSC